jgi:hypothetical protein
MDNDALNTLLAGVNALTLVVTFSGWLDNWHNIQTNPSFGSSKLEKNDPESRAYSSLTLNIKLERIQTPLLVAVVSNMICLLLNSTVAVIRPLCPWATAAWVSQLKGAMIFLGILAWMVGIGGLALCLDHARRTPQDN